MSKRAELKRKAMYVKLYCPECEEVRELEIPIEGVLREIEKQCEVKISVR